jgi:hypothetical protein
VMLRTADELEATRCRVPVPVDINCEQSSWQMQRQGRDDAVLHHPSECWAQPELLAVNPRNVNMVRELPGAVALFLKNIYLFVAKRNQLSSKKIFYTLIACLRSRMLSSHR